METIENKRLKIKDLLEAFKQAGWATSRSWIYRQEEKGNLVLPRGPTDFKRTLGTRKPGAVRYMTQSIINGVLRAFLPEGTKLPNGEIADGRGYYNYQK